MAADDTGNALRKSKCAFGRETRDDEVGEPYCTVCGLRVNAERTDGELTHEAMTDHKVELSWRKAAVPGA
jgi:hypothetical protein